LARQGKFNSFEMSMLLSSDFDGYSHKSANYTLAFGCGLLLDANVSDIERADSE